MTKSLALLAMMTVAVTPGVVLAEAVPIQGAFAVAYSVTLNTAGVSYCDPTNTVLPLAVEAHGDGYSSVGAVSFFLQKGIGFDGTFHGCLTMTAVNGDTLNATYVGQGGAADAGNFSPGSGTLTFTGGTGKFKGATGTAKFTATFANFYPASSFLSGAPAPLQGMAFYIVAGTVSLHGD